MAARSRWLSQGRDSPCCLEVEGPDTIKVKKGLGAGKVSILKMILGEEEGCVCQLTTWRDMVEVWGGYGLGSDPRRGGHCSL